MNLLSNSTINIATGALNNLFDTNSRQVIIHKEPIKIISSGYTVQGNNQNGLYGYGDNAMPIQDITYQDVSGVFNAVILFNYRRPRYGDSVTSQTTEFKLIDGATYMKVKSDANQFIINGGKVTSIQVDDKLYNLGNSRATEYFWGLRHYLFELTETT